MSKLKVKVLELAEIAKECPENLQVVCFELILKQYLDSLVTKVQIGVDSSSTSDATGLFGPRASDDETMPRIIDADRKHDVLEKDLHAKTRRFMEKYQITQGELNNLFYLEGGSFAPLYEDLKTTKMAEGQIRIALLQALCNALTSGIFDASVEDIRLEANARKYYDKNNFAGNFSNNASFFDFVRYEKSNERVKLSEEGRKKLAEVIRELQ